MQPIAGLPTDYTPRKQVDNVRVNEPHLLHGDIQPASRVEIWNIDTPFLVLSQRLRNRDQ